MWLANWDWILNRKCSQRLGYFTMEFLPHFIGHTNILSMDVVSINLGVICHLTSTLKTQKSNQSFTKYLCSLHTPFSFFSLQKFSSILYIQITHFFQIPSEPSKKLKFSYGYFELFNWRNEVRIILELFCFNPFFHHDSNLGTEFPFYLVYHGHFSSPVHLFSHLHLSCYISVNK